MLQNAYLLAKIGADTAENEQHFAENLPKTDDRREAARARHGARRREPVPREHQRRPAPPQLRAP